MTRLRSHWPWALYAATVAALALGTFAPGTRAWGINVWAFVPKTLAWSLLGIAAVTPPLGLFLRSRIPPGLLRALPALGMATLAISFGVLRTHAHFLGDGYQNLSILAADHVNVKATSRGTIWLLIALKNALGGGESGALAAYRTLAILSGWAFLVLVVLAARRLVPGRFERRGFVAIVATSGVTVLFFGYVENYAPFALAVAAHALHGIHVVRTGRTRWLAPAIVGAAVFFHVLGFALLPSLAWVLASGTPVARALGRLALRVRVFATVAAGTLALLALDVARRDHLGLEFALVPFTRTQFTLEGYTLFSSAHLLDLVNLVFLLVPGVALLVASAFASRERGPVPGFLTALVTSTSATIFVLDPKLGMPRDWDVFAFAGIPWAVAGAWSWASAARRRPGVRAAGPLAALLAVVVLLPRLVVLGSAERALPMFRAYLELDRKKSRNARVHIVNHYRETGRDDLAEAEIEAWNRDYPERAYVEKGVAARHRGDVAEAMRWYRLALQESPQYFDAYNNLADCYLLQQRPDEAILLLRVALAISPGEPGVLTNLGTAEYMRGDPAAARHYWEEALAVQPDGFHPNRNLARLAQEEGDRLGYERLLGRAAASPEAPGEILAEWGSILTDHGREEEAREVCREALRRGVSDRVAAAVLGRFPELGPEMAP